MTDNFKIIKGKKFLWDGEPYESKSIAEDNISRYQADNFETQLLEEEGKYLVYTRRVVTEIVVNAEGG